jgi:hypothetical protein
MNVCRACVCDVPSHFALILLPVPFTQPARRSNQGSVTFHILRTLLDPDPIIVTRECRLRGTCSYLILEFLVPETLSNSTGSVLPEILWNFVRFKDNRRLELAQNPHFYRDLPLLRNGYQGDFQSRPTKNYEGTIYVLTNSSHRVILECVSPSRVLDNVWDTSNTLIFRGLCLSFLSFPN